MLIIVLFFIFVLVIGFGGFYFSFRWGLIGSGIALVLLGAFIYVLLFHISLFL